MALGRVDSESARLRSHAAVLCQVSGGSPRTLQSMKKHGPPPWGMNSVGKRVPLSSEGAVLVDEAVMTVSQSVPTSNLWCPDGPLLLFRAPALGLQTGDQVTRNPICAKLPGDSLTEEKMP
jgi:hypothetical protein